MVPRYPHAPPGPDGATGRELPASGSCENRACDRGV